MPRDKEKKKEYDKKYREKNKEQKKENDKKYREKNKEQIKQQHKEWREENKEHIKEYRKEHKQQQKEWREENKEHIKEYRKEHKQQQKEWSKEYIKTDKGKKVRRISKWKQSGLICENYDKIYEIYVNTNECDNCGIELVEGNYGSNKKCLDHNHRTGLFRNILCTTCNTIRPDYESD